ncbi:MAG: DUF3540 domain-containing protein [Polyangiaceae bacterium]|nr:DUF3540 domain-containing protein [Polyangiaceae bacterium]
MARRSESAAKRRAPAQEPEAAVIRLPDGACAELRGGALELRDPGGRLLVRYAGGTAEIAAPAGDLILSAPAGRVAIRSATDIALEAARDIEHRAARRVAVGAGAAGAPAQLTIEPERAHLKSARVEVEARAGRAVVGQAAVVARQIATTARTITASADRYEITATRLVEKTRDAFRDVADLAQTRIGRARTLVKGAYTLNARRTTVASEEETKVDGKKVLLG